MNRPAMHQCRTCLVVVSPGTRRCRHCGAWYPVRGLFWYRFRQIELVAVVWLIVIAAMLAILLFWASR